MCTEFFNEKKINKHGMTKIRHMFAIHSQKGKKYRATANSPVVFTYQLDLYGEPAYWIFRSKAI